MKTKTMRTVLQARSIVFGILVSLPLAGTGASASANVDSAAYQAVEPTIEQARANILISRQLQFTHFRDQAINDDLANEVFDDYLDYLDGQRIYLTQQDIQSFQRYKQGMAAGLRTGQLQPGFAIYN